MSQQSLRVALVALMWRFCGAWGAALCCLNLGATNSPGVHFLTNVALVWRLYGAAGNVALVPFLMKIGLAKNLQFR